MKKSFATLAASAMLGLGLVATTSGAANAACGASYTGPCAPTESTAGTPSTATPGKPAKLTLRVETNSNIAPTGKAIFVVKKKGKKGPGSFFKVEKYYNGGKLNVFTPGLKRGNYNVKVKFQPNPNSNFAPSVDRANLKVGK